MPSHFTKACAQTFNFVFDSSLKMISQNIWETIDLMALHELICNMITRTLWSKIVLTKGPVIIYQLRGLGQYVGG